MEQGYTIKGVQRILSAQGIGVVQQAGGASGEELGLVGELDETIECRHRRGAVR